MKKRLFISTNNNGIRPLRGLFGGADFANIRQLAIYNTLAFPNDCDILYYDGDTNSFKSNVIDTDIILIRDSLLALPENIKIDSVADFLLHHNQENAHLDYIKPLFEQKTEGHHIPNEVNKYVPAFKIIFDDVISSANKVEEIIKAIFYDPEEEKLADAIFTAIYEKKTEQEIEVAIKTRDNYLRDTTNKK